MQYLNRRTKQLMMLTAQKNPWKVNRIGHQQRKMIHLYAHILCDAFVLTCSKLSSCFISDSITQTVFSIDAFLLFVFIFFSRILQYHLHSSNNTGTLEISFLVDCKRGALVITPLPSKMPLLHLIPPLQLLPRILHKQL